jgi:hypothetical protein
LFLEEEKSPMRQQRGSNTYIVQQNFMRWLGKTTVNEANPPGIVGERGIIEV